MWSDWKTRTKKKASTIHTHRRGTGGGPASSLVLSPIEERVLALMVVANRLDHHHDAVESTFMTVCIPIYLHTYTIPSHKTKITFLVYSSIHYTKIYLSAITEMHGYYS